MVDLDRSAEAAIDRQHRTAPNVVELNGVPPFFQPDNAVVEIRPLHSSHGHAVTV